MSFSHDPRELRFSLAMAFIENAGHPHNTDPSALADFVVKAEAVVLGKSEMHRITILTGPGRYEEIEVPARWLQGLKRPAAD